MDQVAESLDMSWAENVEETSFEGEAPRLQRQMTSDSGYCTFDTQSE